MAQSEEVRLCPSGHKKVFFMSPKYRKTFETNGSPTPSKSFFSGPAKKEKRQWSNSGVVVEWYWSSIGVVLE
jgi:hypothetical protein